jgi:hypothetical protein
MQIHRITRSIVRERQIADTESAFPEYGDASAGQFRFKEREARKKKAKVILSSQKIWIPEQNERRAVRLLCGEKGAEVRIRGYDYATLAKRPQEDSLISCHVHLILSDMYSIVPGGSQEHCQTGRQRIVDKKFQAERGRGSSRSMAEAAAYRKHSRISSISRSGYSAMICCSVKPPASNRNTVATGIRRPRTQGTPPICAGSTVIRSKCFIALVKVLSQAEAISCKARPFCVAAEPKLFFRNHPRAHADGPKVGGSR